MSKIIGKCSLCGGNVLVTEVSSIPTCETCGAKKKTDNTPVVEMIKEDTKKFLID